MKGNERRPSAPRNDGRRLGAPNGGRKMGIARDERRPGVPRNEERNKAVPRGDFRGGNAQKPPTPSRRIALETLTEVTADGAYSTLALDRRLRDAHLKPEDRRFTTALFYGVLEKKMALEYILTQFMDKPNEDALTQENLKMAVYQICYMDVPDYAACGEAVSLSRTLGRESLCPLVNAVCRRIATNKASITWPEDKVERLSLETSTPRWLLDRLIADLGYEETEAFLSYQTPNHPTTIQANTMRTGEEALRAMLESEGFTVEAGAVQGALLVQGGGLADTDAFHKGLFFIQGEASMLAARALGVKGGMQVFDACAAPGGKSFSAALAMNGSGRVHAMDLHEHRVKLIETGAKRLGLENLRPRIGDARDPLPTLQDTMDAVLVDAPCSGLGILGKPDIRYRLTEEDLTSLPEMQLAILNNCSSLVKPGGALVYSTCTVFSAENEDIVNAFLKENAEFALKGLTRLMPERFADSVKDGLLTLMPQRDGVDGFFIARMVRNR